MKIKNLTVQFGEKRALDIEHLEFDRAHCYAVIGHNGCGKSTLARCLSGAMKPTGGSIEFAPDDRVRYMPQRGYPFYGTARKNVLMGAKGKPEDAARADMLIDELGLRKVELSNAKSLSGGETARMALARTLMGPGTWLILDEPTSAFDGESTLAAERLIDWYRSEYRAGVILITHSLKQAERATDRVVFMEAGRVVEQGETAACLAHPETPSLKRFVEIFGS